MPIDAIIALQIATSVASIEALGRRIVAHGPGYRIVAETRQSLTADGLAEWRIYATNLSQSELPVQLSWSWRPSVASMQGPLRIVTTVGPDTVTARTIGRVGGSRSGARIDGPADAFVVDAIDFLLAPGVTTEGELICVLAPCAAADFDGDGAVDGIDFAMLLGSWGAEGGITDLDGNGIVDAADCAILLGAWTPDPRPAE